MTLLSRTSPFHFELFSTIHLVKRLTTSSWASGYNDRCVSEYSKFAVKTAQASLEMCRVVYEAKKELASQDFLKFCNEIGRKGEDSTVRKYLKIGEKYDKFYQYSELLPNSWTSIYEITQLPSDVFEALVATDNSMANMTGDQIKLLKGNDSSTKPSTPDSSSVPLTMPSTNVKKSASSITNESEQSVDSDSTEVDPGFKTKI